MDANEVQALLNHIDNSKVALTGATEIGRKVTKGDQLAWVYTVSPTRVLTGDRSFYPLGTAYTLHKINGYHVGYVGLDTGGNAAMIFVKKV